MHRPGTVSYTHLDVYKRQVYHYYKEYDTAFALIDEVAQMQPADDPLTPQVQARCASVRQELTNGQLPTQ